MAGDGFASIGNFRKAMSKNSKKAKYETIVKTTEEMMAEQIQQEMEEQRMKEIADQEEEEELELENIRKANTTVDDLVNGMDAQMKVTKKKKTRAEKEEAAKIAKASKPITKPGEKTAALKQKHKNKRSRT